MALDPSIFLRGAEIQARQNQQLQNTIGGIVGDYMANKRYQEQMASKEKMLERQNRIEDEKLQMARELHAKKMKPQGIDFDMLEQQAIGVALKQSRGLPLTEEDKAIGTAFDMMKGSSVGQDIYGNIYQKNRPIFGGQQQVGAPVTQQAGGTPIPERFRSDIPKAQLAYEEERAKLTAKEQLGAENTLPQAEDAVNTAVDIIDDVLGEDLGSVTGGFAGLKGIQSSVMPITENQRRIQPKIDQLSGQTFMQAREKLKGTGTLTDFESRKGEQAYARLSQAQNPEDFKSALRELRDLITKGIETHRKRAGVKDFKYEDKQQPQQKRIKFDAQGNIVE
jgi:hypothetical protein